MPVASIVSGVTDAVTSAIGDYGLYAVFLLMFVDALFPVASEVVMVYAGAVASGAFASQQVVLFGHDFAYGFSAYVAVALAGTLGYTLGAIAGWAIGRYGGRPYVESHGRWLHLDRERGVVGDRRGPALDVLLVRLDVDGFADAVEITLQGSTRHGNLG